MRLGFPRCSPRDRANTVWKVWSGREIINRNKRNKPNNNDTPRNNVCAIDNGLIALQHVLEDGDPEPNQCVENAVPRNGDPRHVLHFKKRPFRPPAEVPIHRLWECAIQSS